MPITTLTPKNEIKAFTRIKAKIRGEKNPNTTNGTILVTLCVCR